MQVDLTERVSWQRRTHIEISKGISAAKFHSVFGPILMVTYACLSNTLLLTGTLGAFSVIFLC
jgi:hypothetical protein